MKLTDKQYRKLILGMVYSFYNRNFSPWDLENCYGKNGGLSLWDYKKRGLSKYSRRELENEIDKLLYDKKCYREEYGEEDIF